MEISTVTLKALKKFIIIIIRMQLLDNKIKRKHFKKKKKK